MTTELTSLTLWLALAQSVQDALDELQTQRKCKTCKYLSVPAKNASYSTALCGIMQAFPRVDYILDDDQHMRRVLCREMNQHGQCKFYEEGPNPINPAQRADTSGGSE